MPYSRSFAGNSWMPVWIWARDEPDRASTQICVADATPLLESCDQCEKARSYSTAEQTPPSYQLTCLVCLQRYDDLIAAQTHLMSEHGLTTFDLAASYRLSSRDLSERAPCYVWALPPALANRMGFCRPSYLVAHLHPLDSPFISSGEGELR